ncbi:uncharacterized protein LOC106349828 [Brassica napus]|uniref:uncharacterized protein LOC106349828 n=1 Tax=Brassica napus TaxID=3708 RepID=UPI0006AB1E6B|nr:uncharacterized protein LOC106349828 [Brassica napus]
MTFTPDAYKMWNDVKRRFSIGNTVRVHQLRAELAGCKQESSSMLDYFGRLSSKWEELLNYKPLPACTCRASAKISQDYEEEKVHMFLMGLDDARFGNVCTNIIGLDPLPDLNSVYQRVVREERRLLSTRVETRQDAVGFVTKTEPSQTGHEKKECWQIIGFPDWWTERNQGGDRSGRARGGRGCGRSNQPRSNAMQAQPSGGRNIPTLTADQWASLTALLEQQRSHPIPDKLNGKKQMGEVILDTGASHHMTGDARLLSDMCDVVGCPVRFADGSAVQATRCGVLRLSEKQILPNDRFTRTLIGPGEERNGVYVYRDVTVRQASCGAVYFVTIVDDYSRAVWIHLLLEKSEVKIVLPNFCNLVLRQFGHPVRTVRSDNGTEFLCLSKYFAENGIVHHTSCVATPQQNGRVERKHRHILNVARSIMFQANLLIKFWGESVLTAAHVINQTPSSFLHGKSPYECLYGKRPSYESLKTFGCLCFAHKSLRDKDKFKARSRRCIFVGYPFGKKGWKLYDLDSEEFFVSRDVEFVET